MNVTGFAPVVRLLTRAHHTIRDLRSELTSVMLRNASLEARLGVALRERDQARRDCETLALMARDKDTALGFLRDAHRIDGLEEEAR